VLIALALAQTWLATMLMSARLPYHGQQPPSSRILVLFAILFTWVSMGFWTALAGFLVLALEATATRSRARRPPA
jgi:membrane glycosyltransferase